MNHKSPIIAQYDAAKKEHPDKLLLFRVGDFYETFRDDAKRLVACGETLRVRIEDGELIPLARFSHQCLESWLQKLLRAKIRVAILEQVE